MAPVTIPVITTIIAKILNIVERLLDEWVQLNVQAWAAHDQGVGYVDNCGPGGLILCQMTDCGNDLVELIEDSVHSLAALLPNILLAFSTSESWMGNVLGGGFHTGT